MRLRIAISILGLTAIFICACGTKDIPSPICNGDPRTQSEMLQLAEQQLQKFCVLNKIPREEFRAPPNLLYMSEEKLWVMDYQSPSLFVRFTVDNCGAIETGSGPPSKVIKIH